VGKTSFQTIEFSTFRHSHSVYLIYYSLNNQITNDNIRRLIWHKFEQTKRVPPQPIYKILNFGTNIFFKKNGVARLTYPRIPKKLEAFLWSNPTDWLINGHLWFFNLVHMQEKLKVCSKVWLQLLFKVFFMPKCIKMIFFYFKKIIFKINGSKRSKIHKKINF
jgi:hypothetical protein